MEYLQYFLAQGAGILIVLGVALFTAGLSAEPFPKGIILCRRLRRGGVSAFIFGVILLAVAFL